MGNQYIDKASGRVVTLEGADALAGVKSGAYEPVGGGVSVTTPAGNAGSVSAQQLLSDPSLGAVDPLASRAAGAAFEQEQLYNSFEHKSQAFGQGILSGQTFGLTDALGDDTAAIAEQHPWLRLGGNLVGGASLGSFGAGAGSALAPGSKGAAALIGGGLEGMAFGAGQATSTLVLRNEPLTAESVFTEYGTDIFLGGAFGGIGGLAGHALEGAGSKLFKRGTAKLAPDPEDVLAANAADLGAVSLESARGHVLTEDFLKSADNSTKLADEFVAEIAKRPVLVEAPVGANGPPKSIAELPDAMFTGEGALSGRNAIQFVEDAADEAVTSAEGLARKELIPQVRAVRNSRRKLSELINAEGNPNAQTVGTGATKGKNLFGTTPPGEIKVAFTKLHDATEALAKGLDDPGILENMLQGAKLPDGTRKGGLAQFYDEAATVSALPKAGSIEPTVKETATAYQAARDELFGSLYVRDGKVASKRTLQVLGELEPKAAFKVINSYSAYVKSAGAMGDALGPEFAAKSALLKAELSKVTKAVSALVHPGPEAGAAASIALPDILAAVGITEAIPEFDGPGDEMARLWLLSAMLKGKFKGAGSGVATAGVSKAAGGSPIVGGIKAAVASMGSHWTLGKIMGNTAKLASITSNAGARSQQAVGKLLQGAGKATRKASAFAPLALLKSVKFANVEHDPKSTPFEQRAREIRMNVANSYGMQKTVQANLGEIGLHYPGVADKAIAQADRTMKFLGMKLPRDPGVVTRLGRSSWKASDQDISKFTRYMRAAIDPDGELDRFADGELSLEGAETLRTLYPARFAKFQEHIAANLPALQDSLSYAQQVNMSVLFDVPVTSCMEPSAIKAFQATFAADASSDPVSQAPNGLSSSPTPLSPAQEMLAR